MERPDRIEKREYKCKSCEYTAQVYGDTYFDSGCHNYMATFECPDCKVLFEGLISQIDMDEVKFEATHGLADDFECLNCGGTNSTVWNKEDRACPKCSGKMEIAVIEQIKLKWQ